MNFPKTICLPAIVLLGTIAPATADEASAAADRDRAGELFPLIEAAIEAGDDSWEEPFAEFLAFDESVQAILGTQLKDLYDDAVRELQIEFEELADAPPLTPEERREETAARTELNEIRALSETEMKTELKARGWTAQEKLLALMQSNRAGASGGQDALDALEPPMRRLEITSTMLNRMAEARGVPPVIRAMDVRAGRQMIEARREAITLSAEHRVVLDQNAAMSDVPAAMRAGVREVNMWRIAQGFGPLLIDPKLCEAAADHGKDMATLGFFDHTSPVEGKRTPLDRAKNFGTSAGGENIAVNSSISASNRAWFYSPGHHVNMFRPRYTVIGVGGHGRHFVQMFR